MDIYTAAGLDQSDIETMRTSLNEIIGDSPNIETMLQRAVERYDRTSFVVGMLIGMEMRVVTDERGMELQMADPNNN